MAFLHKQFHLTACGWGKTGCNKDYLRGLIQVLMGGGRRDLDGSAAQQRRVLLGIQSNPDSQSDSAPYLACDFHFFLIRASVSPFQMPNFQERVYPGSSLILVCILVQEGDLNLMSHFRDSDWVTWELKPLFVLF